MERFETSAPFYEYRGELFRLHSGTATAKRVWVEGELTSERFPDALEFGADSAEPWVLLPTEAFDARFQRTVSGRWNGVPVHVVSQIERGRNRGLVRISYAGNHPDEAKAAGMPGDQHNGWGGDVPPSEIADISVEMTERERMQKNRDSSG
ncbi:hypothetical protein ACLBXX_04210 [Microbacterium sp. C23T]